MKQEETLEEAIKREYETRKFNSDFPFDPQSFKLGAKWQQERMYSEKDMKKFIVYYWTEKNDDAVDFEKEIVAFDFDEAYSKFRNEYPNVKIWSIKLEI